MPEPLPTPRPPSPPWSGMAALGLLLLALVTYFHLASGSSHSELGSHPDEAAHFVTGLMVRDYLASGFHESPLRYADEYYRHYPKIGLGVWPPFFYIVQALWTSIFPAQPGSLLHLIALLALALALLTAWWLWREFGALQAAAGSILLIALPLVQQYSNMVMAECLSALLMFAATGWFALYLEGDEWRGALGFGICAGLAIMTKGTGLALVFVPAFAILFTGRYRLLLRPSLWIAGFLVALIAGPWTWHFRNQGRGGWEEPSPSLRFTGMAIAYYAREMCVALGALLALLALAGALSLLLPRASGSPRRAIALCSLALVLGVWIFQCLMPVGLEARHLTPAMPALIMLAITGLHALTSPCCPRLRPAIALAILALFFGLPAIFHPPTPAPGYGSLGNAVALSPFRIPIKLWSGFQPIAQAATAAGPSHQVLVASDSRGEGMLIAGIAALDPHRPAYTVRRASKILSSSTWSGGSFQSFYSTPAQVLAMLRGSGIDTIVLDLSRDKTPPDEQLLLQAVTSAASGFSPVGQWPLTRDGQTHPDALQVFQRPATP